MKRAVEQINGREAKTATFLSRCPSNSKLRIIGFALRHLKRCASFFSNENAKP
ncbi:MAG: hypothetical protein JWP66_2012 [Naasia sp.]|nr:hypothetical protein [Naasia sp.]